MKKLYKYLRLVDGEIKSDLGNHKWKVGKWYVEDKIDICSQGFHASKTPLQALKYVSGEILAEVSVRGKSEVEENKECWSEMKIDKAWYWTKKDSVELSIFAAELCLENFEKLYPNDKRPREAIEAARKVLVSDTKENRLAARLAADSAESAADSVEWADSAKKSFISKLNKARLAADSAQSAAKSAADSAEWAVAWAAKSAAKSAESVKKSFISKLNKWYIKKIKTLQEYGK